MTIKELFSYFARSPIGLVAFLDLLDSNLDQQTKDNLFLSAKVSINKSIDDKKQELEEGKIK